MGVPSTEGAGLEEGCTWSRGRAKDRFTEEGNVKCGSGIEDTGVKGKYQVRFSNRGN